ncbi:hypothetical protein [Streptomyces cavernicola]|uniref:PE-PGRS family protein n=1 Tax=Streptomyces cavernicola TaxID=3043613 RepID=A0ABT6SK20_9ACTN|nr:hypothetical protein [Streptomyces sp. B-S-A6]MDI3408526.1 hypothetical protein [Streptomyces sp. B-S-A6]
MDLFGPPSEPPVRARPGSAGAAPESLSDGLLDLLDEEDELRPHHPGRGQVSQLPPAEGQSDPDPVRAVWQLPRFGLGGRRYVGRVDHALVFVTRNGSYETYLPPHRPTTLRRYAALYEVNTDPHSFPLRVPLPSDEDSFEFEVGVDVTWRVVDPEAFVRSQERDVPGLLTRRLLPLMRRTSRAYAIDASAAAEVAVQQTLDAAEAVGEAEGLRVSCSVRLRRDAAERHHQSRLRTARHEAEAATPEHQAWQRRDQQEVERRTARLDFYERQLAKGGTAALALHLAIHPQDTSTVLDRLKADQSELLLAQLDLIKAALDNERLEEHQLDEPHELIAARMTAILRATSRTTDSDGPEHPELPSPDRLSKDHLSKNRPHPPESAT